MSTLDWHSSLTRRLGLRSLPGGHLYMHSPDGVSQLLICIGKRKVCKLRTSSYWYGHDWYDDGCPSLHHPFHFPINFLLRLKRRLYTLDSIVMRACSFLTSLLLSLLAQAALLKLSPTRAYILVSLAFFTKLLLFSTSSAAPVVVLRTYTRHRLAR